eukprot:8359402-Alexandrium_andersonii.AAC.1
MQRWPAPERSLAELQAATALPAVLRQSVHSDAARGAVVEPAEAVADLPPPPLPGRRPSSVFVADEDLRRFGCAAGRSRCVSARWPTARRHQAQGW